MKRLFHIIVLTFLLTAAAFAVGSTVTGTESTSARSSALNGTNWLDGWAYRKAHNISGSVAGEQFNYPILLSIHYNNGADFQGDVYLSGKCRSDFGDIRFTDSSGANPLDYFIQEKTDANKAVTWVKINYIPSEPSYTTIYIYYGNPNASSISNKDWVLDSYSNFEDGTTQGWSVSWNTYVDGDGVSNNSYAGNFSRWAGRIYGYGHAGTGDFYDQFHQGMNLAAGSYRIEASAQLERGIPADPYITPMNITLMVNGESIDNVSNPDGLWHQLGNNLTLSNDLHIDIEIEFHLFVQSTLWGGSQHYFADSILVRKWCDPEPTHGSWNTEQSSSDNTPPQIFLVAWIPASPYPFGPSSVPRQGEPILVMANVSDEPGGSGLDFVGICFRITGGEWCNASMTFNQTTGWWITIMPGQPGNSTLEFFVKATDKAGNTNASGIDSSMVTPLIPGDINGDGIVDIYDAILLAGHYNQHYP